MVNIFSSTRRSVVNNIGWSILKLFCFLMVVPLSHCLELGAVVSPKPRITKYSKTTFTPGPTVPATERSFSIATYRLNNSNSVTCVLMTVDAIIDIFYTTKLNERNNEDIFVPNNAKVNGNCRDEDAETMTLSFKDFTLEWAFAKTPGGEHWYVDSIRLWYNTSAPLLQHAANRNARVTLSTAPRALLFPTPVGKTFVCPKETIIELTNLDPSSTIDHSAKLYLREFKLQAFMYKKDGKYGPEWDCSNTGQFRSEAAPVAVGAALAIATAATLIGYAAWRYVKVKKVQYDTME